MRLRSIMSRYPRVVAPTDSLEHARNTMVWGGFRHLPVLEDGKLVGLVTDRDLAKHLAKSGADGLDDSVSDAMVRHVHTAGPDDSATEAAARLAASREGCLPVTEQGKLVGMVTTTDVLAAEVRRDMAPTGDDAFVVGEVMSRFLEIVAPEDFLTAAASTMQLGKIRHLPVVDEGELVGMLSEKDVRTAVGDPLSAFGGERTSSMPVNMLRVADAMTSPAIAVRENESCRAAARALADGRLGAVAVVDDDDELVGIASYVDILGAFAH